MLTSRVSGGGSRNARVSTRLVTALQPAGGTFIVWTLAGICGLLVVGEPGEFDLLADPGVDPGPHPVQPLLAGRVIVGKLSGAFPPPDQAKVGAQRKRVPDADDVEQLVMTGMGEDDHIGVRRGTERGDGSGLRG